MVRFRVRGVGIGLVYTHRLTEYAVQHIRMHNPVNK